MPQPPTTTPCPACAGALVEERYDGHYGSTVRIDVCHACNGLWFDGREAQRLSPRSTLALFASMRRRGAPTGPTQAPTACLRCNGALVLTHDTVRGTPFSYFRCARECGRFITFVMFLREKQLTHDASTDEVSALAARVEQVRCSQCGAPISLNDTARCPSCHAPVTLLGSDELDATLAHLEVPDAAALKKAREQDAGAVARALARPPGPRSAPDLLDDGLEALLGLFRR